jgi:hypothetical protein
VKIRNMSRWTKGLAALATLALFSFDAGAAPITEFDEDFGGFADGGVLSIEFDGDTGFDSLLTVPPPGGPFGELTEFTASYDDLSVLTAAGPIVWELIDVGGMLYDETSLTLVTLSAANLFTAPIPYFLEFGTAIAAARGNLIDITDITGTVVASVPLPTAGVPLPPTLLLFGLGLLLVGRSRR